MRVATALVFGAIFFGTFFFLPPLYFTSLLVLICGLVLWESVRIIPKNYWFLAVLYAVIPFSLMILLNTEQYRPLLLLLFVTVFVFDTGSYVAGNVLGKHKIAPSISPNKTWEGFLGGYLAVSLALGLLFGWSKGIVPTGHFIDRLVLVTFIVSVLALFGDFFESWLKRRAGVKDSGMLLPGHGGFLDRFDAIMVVAPFFYLCHDWLLRLFF